MAKKFFSVFLLCLLICVSVCETTLTVPAADIGQEDAKYIKWVDFNVSYEALRDAMELDIETFEQDLHLPWVESLAYLACINGGNFSGYRAAALEDFAEKRLAGSSIDDLTKDFKVYDYYYQAYSAVIGGMLGFREDGTYGLTAFSPVAEGYWYTESDDFGNGRSYGFARKHLGHDMFCSVGTPIASVEDGKIEALGWNQYGGWRIGVRSSDGQRYYYYAHLRKDAPFAKGLKIGDSVKAGQIIGYSGQSGYSIKENVNNINVPHLHFGMQLIFDESQKECLSEIWINTYPLIRLLSKHRAPASAPGAASVPGDKNASGPAAEDALGPAAKTAPASEKDPSQEMPREAGQSTDLPILMYHGLTDQPSQVGDYYVPAETFEADMKYLKNHGYTAITMTQLIDYVLDKSGKKTLPAKPVIITFDDGFLNNHTFGTPALKKHGMKGVISVIAGASDEMSRTKYKNAASCAASWNQLKEMADSGVWEIQNHTFNLHEIRNGRKGAGRKAGEDEQSYEKMLKKDLEKAQQLIYDAVETYPNTFTWPYGAYTKESRGLLKSMGFQATLGCESGINKIVKGDKESLFLLKRNIRKPYTSIESCLGE